MRQPKRMTAKYAGTCTTCSQEIEPGNEIIFHGRGRAQHANCSTANYQNTHCSCCEGRGRNWRNDMCLQCEGTGKRMTIAAHAPDSDRLYEDACARACGF